MKRDGYRQSYWQHTYPVSDPAGNTAEPGQDTFDVIIAGAGITGITTGLLLQQRGMRCLILEANTVGFGTTSGTSAHLNTVLDTPYSTIAKNFGQEGAELAARGAREAINVIADMVRALSIDCDFDWCDGIMYATDESEDKALQELCTATRAAGVLCDDTGEADIPMPHSSAVSFPGQARFHPLKYLSALRDAYIASGGKLREQFLVSDTKMDGDRIVVGGAKGTFSAAAVVWATHTAPGINLLTFRLAPYRSYIIGVSLRDESLYPETLIYDMKDPYHYFRTAVHHGQKVLIAGGCDHKTGHHDHTERIFTELEAFVRQYYPVKEVQYRWSSQYYETTDGLPYIGLLPGGAGHEYVAAGFSGNGLIFGTLSAIVITDLIKNGTSIYADLFKPSRVKPVAGFKNFIMENADVVKHMVADRAMIGQLEEIAQLANGEARVVNYQEHHVALYRDEQGGLHALNPVCPHAGCIVQWNTAEKSWDCPCHGGRYSPEGLLLNGPAKKGLSAIDLAGL